MTGDLGVPVENSQRNLSAVMDAQNVGKQQILSAYQEFSNSILSAQNQAQTQQTALVGQEAQMEAQNRAEQTAKDSFLTSALGVLYQHSSVVNGKVTGAVTAANGNPIYTQAGPSN